MGRKNIAILIDEKYKSCFLSEFTESQKTKKDFLVEIANEFIGNENLNMDKIELPEVKRGGIPKRTEEEKKEIKRKYQREYYSKKKNDEKFIKNESRRSSEWRKKIIIL